MKAVAGMTAVITSIKPVVNHCTVDTGIPKSFMKMGKAILVDTSFSMAKNAANIKSSFIIVGFIDSLYINGFFNI
jgi:hypothetical protein